MKKFVALIAACAAIVALAAPAGALAWTHEGEPLTEDGAVAGEGGLSFTFGINCKSGVVLGCRSIRAG